MEEKKEKKVEGRSTKSKAMTVMLGIAFFCILSLLLLAIFDDGTIFGGKEPEKPTEQEQKEPGNTNKPTSYYGKYVFEDVNEEDSSLSYEEYFVINEDGTASIHAVTGDNGAFEDFDTKFTIEKEEDNTIIKFSEYSTAEEGNWYMYALDLKQTETGYKAIPSGYNNKCTGPSSCNIEFVRK